MSDKKRRYRVMFAFNDPVIVRATGYADAAFKAYENNNRKPSSTKSIGSIAQGRNLVQVLWIDPCPSCHQMRLHGEQVEVYLLPAAATENQT